MNNGVFLSYICSYKQLVTGNEIKVVRRGWSEMDQGEVEESDHFEDSKNYSSLRTGG